MKQLLSGLACILCAHHVWSHSAQVSVKAGSWSFATENVRANNESASGFGAYAIELGYSFVPKFLFTFGVNLIFSDIYQGSSGYGFDLGTKYFPLTAAGTDTLSTTQSEISIREKWRPYIGLFMRQRIFGLALSSSYLGPGACMGLDYAVGKDWILSAEFRYDQLYGSGNAIAIQNNILIGIGKEF